MGAAVAAAGARTTAAATRAAQAGEAVATGVQAGAAKRAERAAAGKPAYVKGRGRGRANATRPMLVTALGIMFGMGVAKNLLVDRQWPDRKFWVGSLTVAAVLAVASDLTPRAARWMNMGVIVSMVYAYTVPIVQELDSLGTPEADTSSSAPGGTDTTPAAAGTNSALEPVFLRSVGGGVRPTGGPGAATEQFVSAGRRRPRRARRPRRRGPAGANVPTYSI